MTTYYFIIGLTYFIIGFGVALIFYYVMKKRFLGNFIGALIVALIGSFLGGVIDFFFDDIIESLANINGSINIFPPIISSFLVIWIFSKLSENK